MHVRRIASNAKRWTSFSDRSQSLPKNVTWLDVRIVGPGGPARKPVSLLYWNAKQRVVCCGEGISGVPGGVSPTKVLTPWRAKQSHRASLASHSTRMCQCRSNRTTVFVVRHSSSCCCDPDNADSDSRKAPHSSMIVFVLFFVVTVVGPAPSSGSLCSECGQNTVCSTCNLCHYCEDIDLPC